MKTLSKIFSIFLVLVVTLTLIYGQNKTPRANWAGYYAISNLPKQPLSEDERQILISLRQEEKLAHDVYFTLFSKWGMPVFNNISKAEAVHTQRIKELLEKYEIQDPVNDLEIGKFADNKYTDLYNQLVQKGSQSLKDAYIVGATIEDMDINDINQALQKVDNDDISIVLTNIKHGSYNHLRAFTHLLYRFFDYKYEPQYISQEEFQQIITRPKKHIPPRMQQR